VIFKEGLTVRGLTTAASIWITASLGILYGVGFYYPAVLGTVATLGVLGAFRWLERRMPSQYFADLQVRFPREKALREADLRQLLAAHEFNISGMSYVLRDGGRIFEFQTAIRTINRNNVEALSTTLLARDDVLEFSIEPSVN
jgi:putative Mg2+ transporter-C (MgtC) family protein